MRAMSTDFPRLSGEPRTPPPTAFDQRDLPLGDAAQRVLEHVFGYPAFRGEQSQIVEHVAGGGDALVLMPTGGGKSLCY